MLSRERTAALRLVTRNRARRWGRHVRSELEQRIGYLRLDAETEEERRDVRRLHDLMNDICAKHERKAQR